MSLEKIKETIFAYDKEVIDCEVLRAKNIDVIHSKIYFQGILLTGSTELPNNEFYFGELDKDNVIKQDKPSYYFSPSDESSGLGRLSIFYKNDELCLLNYSILEKSLNIKLECLSKKSLEYKDLISNSIKEQTLTQIDKKQAIAKLHALLENQNLECIHGGKVILKSSKGKSFKDNNIPIMLESDLLNSSIVACPYTMGNVSYPCTKVVNVKGALTQKKVNGEYAILQELIPACSTDKGFPLKVRFTPTKFKFDHSFDPKEGLIKQSENQTELKEPKLRMYYKEYKYQKDNLLITNLYLNNTLYQNEQGLDKLELSKNDLLNLNDVNMLNILKQDFSKDYDFKECEIKLGVHLLKLIFVIPKNIAKIHKDVYKKFESKDLGAGYFTELHEYNKDYRENENIIHHRVFLAPAKMQKIDFEIAKGLDEWLDNENVCSFNVLTKDYFNTDDENAITNDNVKDDIKNINATKSNNANFNENNTQEIIPDNVIRIETQDGSGEFIEIVFDEFKEWEKSSSGVIKPLFSPLGGILNKARESLENVSIIGDALAILSAVKNPKNAKNIIKKKSKYATKKEVIDVLKNKYNLKTSKELGLGRSENVFWAKDNKQIKEIWNDITDGAEILKDINEDKLGGTIKMRKLSDGTIVKLRQKSKSGGLTIEIDKKPEEQTKIHSIRDLKK